MVFTSNVARVSVMDVVPSVGPVGWLMRGWKWACRNPAVAALLASVLLVFAAGLGGVLWAYGEAVLSIFRRYAQLRYRLLPYLYSAALRAVDGIPLVRPLVYDHPADPTTHHVDDEYFLGPDLLVAPMFKPKGSRDVYLPDGGWYDYWTDRRFDGPRWIRYDADLETLPLFVRAGAVLAMGPELQFANERSWDPLVFDVYPGEEGRSEKEIVDDHRRLQFQLTVDRERVMLDGGPLGYPAEVRIHRSGGQPLRGRLSEAVRLAT